MDAHAGEMGVESQPGLGTTVRVTLPLATDAAAGSMQRTVDVLAAAAVPA